MPSSLSCSGWCAVRAADSMPRRCCRGSPAPAPCPFRMSLQADMTSGGATACRAPHRSCMRAWAAGSPSATASVSASSGLGEDGGTGLLCAATAAVTDSMARREGRRGESSTR